MYLIRAMCPFLLLLSLTLPVAASSHGEQPSPSRGWEYELDLGIAASFRRGLIDGVIDDEGQLSLSLLLSGGAYYGDFYVEANPTTRHPLTLGYTLKRREKYQINMVLESYFFTIEDDKPHITSKLSGIQTRHASLEAGIEYVGSVGNFDIRSRLLHDVLSRHDGAIASIEIARPYFTRKAFFLPSIGITYISKDATDYYFGISQQESSGIRETYRPNGAIIGSIALYVERPINESLSVVGFAGYSVFSSAIADSPIVQPRSDAYNVGLGVLWSF